MATANSLINSRLFLHCEDRSPSAFLSLVQQVEFQILNPSLSFTWCLHGNVWETELLDPVLRLFLYPYPLPYSFAFPLIKVPASWLGFLHVFYLGLKAVSSCNAKISLESVHVVGLAAWCAFAISIRMYPEEPRGTREDERHEGKTQGCSVKQNQPIWLRSVGKNLLFQSLRFGVLCCAPLLWQKLMHWRCNSMVKSNIDIFVQGSLATYGP